MSPSGADLGDRWRAAGVRAGREPRARVHAAARPRGHLSRSRAARCPARPGHWPKPLRQGPATRLGRRRHGSSQGPLRCLTEPGCTAGSQKGPLPGRSALGWFRGRGLWNSPRWVLPVVGAHFKLLKLSLIPWSVSCPSAKLRMSPGSRAASGVSTSSS